MSDKRDDDESRNADRRGAGQLYLFLGVADVGVGLVLFVTSGFVIPYAILTLAGVGLAAYGYVTLRKTRKP
jgi:hypothetical protein